MRAGLARSGLAVLAVAMLGDCAAWDSVNEAAAAASSGGWNIEQKTDPITGAPASTALLRSSKTVNSGLALTPASYLQLGCFKGQPSVGFAFAFGVGTTKNSEFGYRFDAKPGHQISPRILPNHSTIVIAAKGDVRQFASELAAPMPSMSRSGR